MAMRYGHLGEGSDIDLLRSLNSAELSKRPSKWTLPIPWRSLWKQNSDPMVCELPSIWKPPPGCVLFDTRWYWELWVQVPRIILFPQPPPSHRMVNCWGQCLKALKPAGRVPVNLLSPHPVHNLVLFGSPTLQCILRMNAAPGDTNWKSCSTSGIQPVSWHAKLFAASSGSQYTKKEWFKVAITVVCFLLSEQYLRLSNQKKTAHWKSTK
jgi:hypothetical protein